MHVTGGAEIQIVPLEELTPTRYYTAEQIDDLSVSIHIALAARPLIVEDNTKRILSGNRRYMALSNLGYRKVPVLYLTQRENVGRSKNATPGEEAPEGFEHLSMEFISLDALSISVFCVGVFDLFHVGHANLLKRARALGDRLLVGVQYNVERYKKTGPVHDFDQRAFMVRSLRFVDEVVPYENVFFTLKRINPDIFVVGPDQNHEWFEKSKKYCKENSINVEILDRTEGISSSVLREIIKQ